MELFIYSTQPVPFHLLQPIQPIQPISFNQSNHFSHVEDLPGSWFGATNWSAQHLLLYFRWYYINKFNNSTNSPQCNRFNQMELFNHSTQPVPFQLLQPLQPIQQPIQPIQPLSFNRSNHISDIELRRPFGLLVRRNK